MSLIAELSTPPDGFAVGRALPAPAGGSVRLERIVPLAEGTIQFCRVRGDVDAEAFEADLRANPVVARVERCDEDAPDGVGYLVEWTTDAYDGILAAIRDAGCQVLAADGRDDRWTFRLRFPSSSRLGAFQRAVTAAAIDVDVGRVYEPTGDTADPDFGLTDAQLDAIVTAVETGFFRVPRDISTVDLGAILGISDQAVSERLRRGTETLARNALQLPEPDD